MKRTTKHLGLFLLAVMFAATAFKPTGIQKGIEVGSAIVKSDLKMKDVSGNQLSLNEMKGENGLLVIFVSNQCPFVKMNEAEIAERIAHVTNRKINVVLVNSNEAQRSGDDSFEAMQKYAAGHPLFSPAYYVMDTNAELAKAFGATRTPEFFLFGKNGLAYKGALSSNDAAQFSARQNYLFDAIKSVINNQPVKVSATEAKGSTIKNNN